MRKIKLILSTIFKRKFIQYEYNNIMLDNDFDIMDNFENFRVMIIVSVVSSLYSYLFFMIMTIFVFVFYFFSNYALFTSNYTNRSHFQNYFFYIYHLDFINLTIIYFIKWFGSIIFDLDPYIIIAIYITIDVCKDLYLGLTKKYDMFYYNKEFKAVKHLVKNKLENEKFVNKNLLEEDIININLEVINKNQ